MNHTAVSKSITGMASRKSHRQVDLIILPFDDGAVRKPG